MFWYIICGIIFILIGIFAFFKPDLIWELTEQWKSYYTDEPSDLYLLSTKIGGGIFILLGIAAVVLPFIPE